jgi:hypothetical protein
VVKKKERVSEHGGYACKIGEFLEMLESKTVKVINQQ